MIVMWKLPGIEHMEHGVNLLTGDIEPHPLFQFTFCPYNDPSTTVQDAYRGNVYMLPLEVYAEPLPKCSFNSDAKSFSSSHEFASSLARDNSS
jgi:hypothetical protein